jgi:hypothetical protein
MLKDHVRRHNNFSNKINWVFGNKEVIPILHIRGEMTGIADKIKHQHICAL